WPGNIRELENVIERAVVLNKSNKLVLDEFPDKISKRQKTTVEFSEDDGLISAVNEYERALLISELEKNKGNKFQTALKLKINRSTFMSKLKKYDIN
ncbi:MAG: sigma-54-dependent Fis family transcriptional regulator, partial [Calditrichia bacterium]|nr:sigma-54-dependent Fis family transcriptional regulator [Calditrichia bacterium]